MIFNKWIVIFFSAIIFTGALVSADAEHIYKQINTVEYVGLQTISSEAFQTLPLKIHPGKRLNEDDIVSDINSMYLMGVFKAVSYEIEPFGNLVNLRFLFEENPVVNDVLFSGNTVFDSTSLIQNLENVKGRVLDMTKVAVELDGITHIYKQNGYDLFKVKQVNLVGNDALRVECSEGFVGKVRFQGLKSIQPFVLYRAIQSQPGSVFNSKRLRKDRVKMLKLGYFELISPPNLKVGESANEVDIYFNVSEKKVNLFDLGLETDSDQLVSFVQLNVNHLFLHSSVTSLKGQLGLNPGNIDVQGYSLRHFQPWLLNVVPVSYAVDGWFDIRDPVGVVPAHKRQGYDSVLGFPLLRDRLTLSLKFKSEDIFDIQAPYTLQTVSGKLIYSSVEDWSNPQFGTYWNLEYEQGGDFDIIKLGSLNIKRLNFNWGAFLSLIEDQTLALHGFAGLIEDDAISIESEKYLIGGSSSVRGFLEGQFSGSRKAQLNIEYRVTRSDVWQGIIFLDAGKVFNQGDPVNTENIKIGKGIGLRLFTPVGPFRFDLGFGETETVLHFNIGQVF